MMLRCFVVIISIVIQITIHAQSLYFPPLTGSTWDTITPSSIGYCQPQIDSLYNYLQAKNSKSFILLKDGKIVLEKYFGAYTKDSIWYWASAGKSLTGFLTGIAQQKGFININNKVSQYLGNNWSSAPLVKENLITVKHLISMTSGLEDVPPTPCTNEDTAKACLIYKVDAGTRWAYHSGAYRKTQDVISQAAGQNYNTITNNWIEASTGMSGFWYNQVYFSKARDMARFGLLILNRGIWNTDTLLKDTTYFKQMVNSSQTLNKAYGYLWWLNGKSDFMVPTSQIVIPGTMIPNAPSDMYCALGKNDQKIYVVPSQKLVVIRQGNSAGGFNLALSSFDNTLWNYINQLSCATAIQSNYKEQLFTLYPNPVTSVFTIENNTQNIKQIELLDVFGRIVYIKNQDLDSTNITIDLSEFKNGIYVIKITTRNQDIVRQYVIKN